MALRILYIIKQPMSTIFYLFTGDYNLKMSLFSRVGGFRASEFSARGF